MNNPLIGNSDYTTIILSNNKILKKDTITESEYLLMLFEYYKNVDMQSIKCNLKNAIQPLYNKIGKNALLKQLQLKDSTFQACIYPTHLSNISFEMLLLICSRLNISPFDILHKTEYHKKFERIDIKRWTDDEINKFIKLYQDNNAEYVSEIYSLTIKTVKHYYKNFTQQKEINKDNK